MQPSSTVALDAAGKAPFNTASLTVGGHAIAAVYSGDTTHASSTSAMLTQDVGQDAGAPVKDAGTGGEVESGTGAGTNGTDTSSPGGCGCRAAASSTSFASLVALSGLVVLGARRLRRRVARQNESA